MRLHRGWAGAGALLACFSLALAADKKNPDLDTDKGKAEATSKLVSAGEVTGKLISWDGSGKFFTVEVKVKYAVPNPSALQALANLQVQLAQAARERNPATRQQRIAQISVQMAQQQKNAQQIKEAAVKFELEATEDMKVRYVQPPAVFDETGKLRKHTGKELKDLKGDNPKMPGYAAEMSDVQKDQYVTAYIAKKREAPRSAGKNKDNDAETPNNANRYLARILLLHPEQPK